MPSSATQTQQQLELLSSAIDDGSLAPVARMLNALPAAETAHLLESSPPRMRQALWALIDRDSEGDILASLPEELQSSFLKDMDVDELIELTEGLESDDIADILQQLPRTVIHEVLASMDSQDRHRVERVIQYQDNTAGGLMSTEMITVRAPITLDVVLRYLRRHDQLPSNSDAIYVVGRQDTLIGVLPIAKLLISDPNSTVREVMKTDIYTLTADIEDTQVAQLFERNDWVSAPVVDKAGKLLGRITIDDVVDVIRDDFEHSINSLAGISDEEETFSSIKDTVPRRMVWLGINLITALLASASIKMFEGTIDKVVALAVLMPIVASMGGIAGSQTLTVVIRGMALGLIGKNNASWLLQREVIISFINGIVWALVVGTLASLIYNDFTLAIVLATAMILNLFVAAFVGTLLPISLERLNIDPALAGGVLLTTVTDIFGFAIFLGLASYFYG
ncbi:MAG: magnesium transporter [Pseudomonadales bacterium]|nr:magnesium transporter [Pseudomonadales bacterium]